MIKKICILTTAHNATDIRIFHKEARTLSNAGYKVEVIGQNARRETVDEIEILPFPPSQRFIRFFLMPLKMFFLAARRRADVYHFHDPELIVTGIFIKIFCRKPVIYDVHEDYSQAIFNREWLPEFLKPIVSSVFNVFEKNAARFFDCVVAATPHIASFFREPKIVLFNYPLFSYFNNFGGLAVRCRSVADFVAICIGNFEAVRGVEQIVRAIDIASRGSKVSLKLIGKFTENDFKQKIKELPGWSKTDFSEWMPLKEAYAAVAAADAGLVCFLPTRVNLEAVPNKIFEYMASGLPLIYSDFPHWQNIAGGCGIAVDPKNPESIAAAIEYLASHPHQAAEMGKKGQKMVKEVYNWEMEGKKLLEVYRDL